MVCYWDEFPGVSPVMVVCWDVYWDVYWADCLERVCYWGVCLVSNWVEWDANWDEKRVLNLVSNWDARSVFCWGRDDSLTGFVLQKVWRVKRLHHESRRVLRLRPFRRGLIIHKGDN